jgi:geranylgeranyl pyrophosphate synthase
MSDAVLAPGKRIRPLVVVLAGEALGCDSPALLDAGCALELVHTASLLLDDLPCMDDAQLRRAARQPMCASVRTWLCWPPSHCSAAPSAL